MQKLYVTPWLQAISGQDAVKGDYDKAHVDTELMAEAFRKQGAPETAIAKFILFISQGCTMAGALCGLSEEGDVYAIPYNQDIFGEKAPWLK